MGAHTGVGSSTYMYMGGDHCILFGLGRTAVWLLNINMVLKGDMLFYF